MSAMRSNCGDGCTWSFQDLEAYRRWGSRGTWVACSTGRSVDSAAATRNSNPLSCISGQGLCSTSKKQPGAGASLVIVQYELHQTPEEAKIPLGSAPPFSIPESHNGLVADPCSPHPSLVSTKCFPTSRIYTTSSATYYTNCVDIVTILGFKASGELPVLTILQYSCQPRFRTTAP
jgi:hypothetical protein